MVDSLFEEIDRMMDEILGTGKSKNDTGKSNRADIGDMLEQILSTTSQAPNQLSSISLVELLAAFDPKSDMPTKFTNRNLNRFRQAHPDSNSFVNTYFNALRSIDPSVSATGKKSTEIQFEYLFGIPVLVVDRLLWTTPVSNIHISNGYWRPGIVCVHSDELVKDLKIEIMREILNWLKNDKMFKIPGIQPNIPMDRLYIKTRRDMMVSARTEIILRLTADPGFLYDMADTEVISYLCDSKISVVESIPEDFYSLIRKVVDFVKAVDNGNYSKMTRTKLCQIMYSQTDCVAILKAIADHISK
jgi:hypothetical protein